MSHHTASKFLLQRITNTGIKAGERYYHYKNPHLHYEVVTIALCEEDEQPVVVYRSLYDELIWTRKVSVWNEEIDGVKRFTLVKE